MARAIRSNCCKDPKHHFWPEVLSRPISIRLAVSLKGFRRLMSRSRSVRIFFSTSLFTYGLMVSEAERAEKIGRWTHLHDGNPSISELFDDGSHRYTVLLCALNSQFSALRKRRENRLTFSFMYFLISGASASLISIRLMCRASTTDCTR